MRPTHARRLKNAPQDRHKNRLSATLFGHRAKSTLIEHAPHDSVSRETGIIKESGSAKTQPASELPPLRASGDRRADLLRA
jgi:hypothetical protein